MSPVTREHILASLDVARHQLLDLSSRNRLLNFRPSKTRGVEVVDEDPVEIYRVLVTENKQMVFAGARDSAAKQRTSGEGEADTEPVFESLPIDTMDLTLNTQEPESKLHARLLRTYYDAQTTIEEQGVNTLFLALGFLQWYEDDTSEEPRQAPLILIPAGLDRKGPQSQRFKLSYTGDDLGTNLSLAAKLREDSHIELPELDEEDLDVAAYFRAVAVAVAEKKRWQVHTTKVALGFFSYAKYLMFKDLDPANWVGALDPCNHPVLAPLLGDGFETPSDLPSDDASVDPLRPPEKAFEVVEADSSQRLALLDVERGVSMVIEGPPGTGKSQTITNVIAESIAAGKKVLFVAEKNAALTVVKRMLDKQGIGDPCLELHSHKTKKRGFLEELNRTIALDPPEEVDHAPLWRLGAYTDALNNYVRALHTGISQSGTTAYDAMGRLVQIHQKAGILPETDFNEISSCSRRDFDERLAKVRELQAVIAAIGVPQVHPFFECHPPALLPSDLPQTAQRIVAAQTATNAAAGALADLATHLSLDPPKTQTGLGDFLRTAEFVMTTPEGIHRVNLPVSNWVSERKRIEELLAAGVRLQRLQKQYGPTLMPEAWHADVVTVRGRLAAHGRKWYRLLISDFRGARRRLDELCRDGCPGTLADRLALLDAILDYQRLRRAIQQAQALDSLLFRGEWRAEKSNWENLETWFRFTLRLHEKIAVEPSLSGLLSFLQKPLVRGDLRQRISGLGDALGHLTSRWQPLLDPLKPSEQVFSGAFEACPFTLLLQRLDGWLSNVNRLPEIYQYNLVRKRVADLGLQSLCELADRFEKGGSLLEAVFENTWFNGLLRVAFAEHPELAEFNREAHEEKIRSFGELDREMFRLNRARVALSHFEAVDRLRIAGVHGGFGNLKVLLEQFHRQRRHLPIRQLMKKCGQAIQEIKPVFMMSPLSVAMFLPPDGPHFDLVVFDEASQIRPEDAFGPILRGRQGVVVGDSQQMPPTAFFMRLLQGDGQEQEEEEESVSSVGDMESILKLFRARSAHARDLRWHYRSRHHSLIAVSNREFYRDRLFVFPSTSDQKSKEGLSHAHVPDTVYGRGGTKRNPEEAKAVAQAIVKHAETVPELTLGVVAFSQVQQEEIVNQLEFLRRQSPELQEFETRHSFERLFIKNLENVQGDERDVIFISVGYGKDQGGYLSHNFGPVNTEGGERRLNVLISRARERCIVFSNFLPEEIDLARTNSRGVRVLKAFLRYARDREMETPRPTGAPPQSPFEQAVLEALQHEGWRVDCQVGSAGFFIDLAVVDPAKPGRYMLGIECDGAQYHSARSARDRDRLREQVLQLKGWNLHRIWSSDWFRNPDKELHKTIEAIERARLIGQPAANPPANTDDEANPVPRGPAGADNPTTVPESKAVPYREFRYAKTLDLGNFELHNVPTQWLADRVLDVVKLESPVHLIEVARRLRECAGLGRTGSRIQQAVQTAVEELCRQDRVEVREPFVWVKGMAEPDVRNREHFPNNRKTLELVAPEEIQKAIMLVVGSAFGIKRSELAKQACYLLGFARITEDMIERCTGEILTLIRLGKLVETNGEIHLP